jgi:hypothetical protein
LAKHLNAKAIALIRKDTDGGLGYEFFDKRELVETANYNYGEEKFFWKSKLREKPQLDFRKQDGKKVTESQQPKIILSPYAKSWLMPDITPLMASNQPQKSNNNFSDIDEFERMLENDWFIWCDCLDGIFTELGIYLPAFYPIRDENGVYLEVEKCSEGCIDRAVLLYQGNFIPQK